MVFILPNLFDMLAAVPNIVIFLLDTKLWYGCLNILVPQTHERFLLNSIEISIVIVSRLEYKDIEATIFKCIGFLVDAGPCRGVAPGSLAPPKRQFSPDLRGKLH